MDIAMDRFALKPIALFDFMANRDTGFCSNFSMKPKS